LADAIVDLVETGTTMKVAIYYFFILILARDLLDYVIQAAGLGIVSDILNTEAILISSKTTKHENIVELIRKRMKGYITSTK